MCVAYSKRKIIKEPWIVSELDLAIYHGKWLKMKREVKINDTASHKTHGSACHSQIDIHPYTAPTWLKKLWSMVQLCSPMNFSTEFLLSYIWYYFLPKA